MDNITQNELRFKINGWYIRETEKISLEKPTDFPPPPQHWYPLPTDEFITKQKGSIKPTSKNWHTTVIPLPHTIDYLEYTAVVCDPEEFVWYIDAVKPVSNETDDPKNNSYKHIHRGFGANKIVRQEETPVRVKSCDRILIHFYPYNKKCEFPTYVSIGFARKKPEVSFA